MYIHVVCRWDAGVAADRIDGFSCRRYNPFLLPAVQTSGKDEGKVDLHVKMPGKADGTTVEDKNRPECQ
jgi:hypothetical protein